MRWNRALKLKPVFVRVESPQAEFKDWVKSSSGLLGKWGSGCPQSGLQSSTTAMLPRGEMTCVFWGWGRRTGFADPALGDGSSWTTWHWSCNPGHTPQQLHTCPMCSNRHSQFTFQFTFELRLWPKFIVGSYQKPTTQSSRNSRIEKNSTSTARRREGKEKRGRNKRNGSKRQARLY